MGQIHGYPAGLASTSSDQSLQNT